MNWDAIGAIAELVGALVVVLTLAYLAKQIRDGNVAARVEANLEITRQYADFIQLLLQNPELFSVYTRGLRNELDEDEERRFGLLMSHATWYWSSMYFQKRAQSLSEEEWHQSKILIQRVSTQPGYIHWWDARKEAYSTDFAAYLDQIIEEGT
jgi:hypothetical protein